MSGAHTKAHKLFQNFDPLIKASATGLPSLSSFLHELRPVMDGLDPFLANFNRWCAGWTTRRRWSPTPLQPVLIDRRLPADSARPERPAPPLEADDDLHSESLSVYQNRITTNRGNGYLQPFAIGSMVPTQNGEIFPAHDCNNTFGGHEVLYVPQGHNSGRRRCPQSRAASSRPPRLSSRAARASFAPNYDVNANHCPRAVRPRTRRAPSPRTSRRSSVAGRSSDHPDQ